MVSKVDKDNKADFNITENKVIFPNIIKLSDILYDEKRCYILMFFTKSTNQSKDTDKMSDAF